MSQKSPLLSGYARDAVIVWINQNLNAALKDADILRADGVETPPITSDRVYIDEGFRPLKYPAIYVIAAEMTFDYSGGPNYVQGEIPLQLIVVTEDVRWEKLQEQLETYSRALFRILDQQSLQDKAQRFQLKMISKKLEFTKTFQPPESTGVKAFRKALIYRWTAKHFENRLTT